MEYFIPNEFIVEINGSLDYVPPKYSTQLLNLANQNAQGTRPTVVGQLSELFPEYERSTEDPSMDDWKKWYIQRYPDALEKATDRVFSQIQKLQEAIMTIDRNLVSKWIEDLVIYKTFNGLYIQKAILAFLAKQMNISYRLADPTEEGQGIDGYLGNEPVQIKPDTYLLMGRLLEDISVDMIIYKKQKKGVSISYK